MASATKQSQNLTYLLHLWRIERNGESVWWASLENPRIGERHAFASLAELFSFLDEMTVNSPRTPEREEPARLDKAPAQPDK